MYPNVLIPFEKTNVKIIKSKTLLKNLKFYEMFVFLQFSKIFGLKGKNQLVSSVLFTSFFFVGVLFFSKNFPNFLKLLARPALRAQRRRRIFFEITLWEMNFFNIIYVDPHSYFFIRKEKILIYSKIIEKLF
jgi:hypothetical protein